MLTTLLTTTALVLAALTAAAPAPQAETAAAAPLPPDHPIWFGRPLYWNYQLSKCMRAEGEWDGAKVFIAPCIDVTYPHTWDVGPYAGQIKLNKTNLCLDAGDYASRANGRKLTVRTCTTSPTRAQTWWYPSHPENPWRRIELAGGPCEARTNMCADLTDGNQENGAIQLWQCAQGNPNQVWDLGPWCRHC